MDKQLLQVRLSIIMKRENLNFLCELNELRLLLRKYFKYDYELDEIENALHEMEENYIERNYNADEDKGILDLPEDFNY